MSKLVAPMQSIDTVHRSALTYIPFQITAARTIPSQQGQVCIASRGKVKKLCMEVNAGTSADVSIRALRGSGGLKSP